MGYKVLNGPQFKAAVAKQIARVKAQAENRIRFVMQAAQIHASQISPVYSGDFASNWNVSVGMPDATFVRGPQAPTYALSFPDPTNTVWGKGTFNMKPGFLGQPVYLSNAAAHDEPYAHMIEAGTINFRDVNLKPIKRDRVAFKTSRQILRMLGV